MRHPAALSIAVLALALAGCASAKPPRVIAMPPAADGVAVKLEYGRFITLAGPRAQHAPLFLGVPNTNFFLLRSWIDRSTGQSATQLFVDTSYFGARKDFTAARDGERRPLRFVAIGHHEITCDSGCSYDDEFGADLPETELQAHPQGLDVTFTAASGDSMTVAVSARQIAAQLAALAAARQALSAAAAQANRPAPSS